VAQNIMAVLEVAEPDKKARADRLDQLLAEFHIERLRDSPAMALSGGERRRCEIARALAANPSIMLLDEPFAVIDPISIQDLPHPASQRQVMLWEAGWGSGLVQPRPRGRADVPRPPPRSSSIPVAGDDAAAPAGDQAAGALQSRDRDLHRRGTGEEPAARSGA